MKYLWITLCVIVFTILFTLLQVVFCKNKVAKTLQLYNNKRNEKYAKGLYQLISINTSNKEDNISRQLFFKKIKELFPLVHKHLKQEKIEGNIFYTYDSPKENVLSVLFVAHMDTLPFTKKIYCTNEEIYGPGTFDSKAFLYSIFQAIEEVLTVKGKLDIDLVLVVTNDDETTKIGNERVVNRLLKRGKFFTLVLEEGSGIIDPSSFGLQSNYALIGIGVTGEMNVCYYISKDKGKKALQQFMSDLKQKNVFKSEIDKNTKRLFRTFAKDMKLKRRLILFYPQIFKKIIQKYLNDKTIEIDKLIKTQIKFGKIFENEQNYCLNATIHLASHDSPAEIIRILMPYLHKYGINYSVEKIIDPSKITSTTSQGYKIVKKAIACVFKDVYVAPFLITKFSNRRYFTKVSDCVIRFSPLYYPHQAIKDAYKGNEHVMKKSLSYSIDFFKKIVCREE